MKNIKRFLNILFLLSFAVIITGCNKPGGNGGETSKELTDEELVQSVIDGVVIPETINKGLELPSEVDGVKIEWSAEDEIILDQTKNLYVIEGQTYEVKLFGLFTYKDIEVSSTYTVKLEQGKNSAINVAWDYFRDKIHFLQALCHCKPRHLGFFLSINTIKKQWIFLKRAVTGIKSMKKKSVIC